MIRSSMPPIDRLIARPFGMIWSHWYRTRLNEPADGRPCTYLGCGQPGSAHLRWCGEWAHPRRHRWAVMARRIAAHRAGAR